MDNIVTALNVQNCLVFFDLPENAPLLHRLRLGQLLLQLKKAILNPFKKFVLYPGHDLIMGALLGSLDIHQTKFSAYASNLLIELWAPKLSTNIS